MLLHTSLLYKTTPIRCTPLPLHPPLQCIQQLKGFCSIRAGENIIKTQLTYILHTYTYHIHIHLRTSYTYTYVYIHTYMYMCIYIYIYMYYILDRAYTCMCVHIHTNSHTKASKARPWASSSATCTRSWAKKYSCLKKD